MKSILLLGDPRLYAVCDPVTEADRPLVTGWVADLDTAMRRVRARYGFGRAIAAVGDVYRCMVAAWAKWNPDFSKYAAVVLDYNGPSWPGAMQTNFVNYVRNGGGVFLVWYQ